MRSQTRADVEKELTGPGAPFELVREDVNGERLLVYKEAPQTLGALIEHPRRDGLRTMLVFNDETMSFEAHRMAVHALAGVFVERYGLRKGDRVAIAMRNYPEWSVAFWACHLAGGIAVPLNAWWTTRELDYALRDCEPAVLVADDQRLARIAPLRESLGLRGVVSVRSAIDGDGDPYTELIGSDDNQRVHTWPTIRPDDIATILYTSGTTGRPKGAIGTNRNHITNLMNNALRSAVVRQMRGLDPQTAGSGDVPVSLQTFPFFHVAGLAALCQSAMTGGTLVLMYKWDAATALDLIERHRVTNLAAVPTIVRDLLDHADLAKRDVSSVASMAMGGAPVPPSLVRAIRDRLGPNIAPMVSYGLTETTSTIVTNLGPEYFAHPGSVGRAVPTAEIKFVDAAGSDVPRGSIGELWCRGANVMPGYWRAPTASAEVLSAGWFRTGDAGFVNSEGLIAIVDRLKDVVVRGGENVYSAEVEAALCEHEDVIEAAVLGVPHPSLGEEVVAVVRLRDNSRSTVEALRAHVADRLATFKVPAHVIVRHDPLPTTSTGKVIKGQLRSELEAFFP